MSDHLEASHAELQRKFEALTEAHHTLSRLLERTQTATLSLDNRLRIEAFTPAFGQLFQLTRTVLNRSLAEVFADSGLEEAVRRAGSAASPQEHEWRSADGRVFLVRIVPDERVRSGGLLLAFTEVTRLMQAQEEAIRLKRILDRINALETLFGVAPVGIALCENPQGEGIRINPCGAALLGIAEQVTGYGVLPQRLPIRLYRDGSELSLEEYPFKTVLCTGQALSGQQVRLVRGDGSELDVMISAVPLLDQQGAVRGVVAVFTDITEPMRNQRLAGRQRMEQELSVTQQRLALTQAEERMRQAERLSSLGALAAGMAHEINNPLNAILMNAELGLMSLEKKLDSERLTQILRRIVDDAKRGGTITRNVVQFARADNYKPQGLNDLNEIINASHKLVASILQRYDVALHLQLEPDLPQLELHRTALEQAVVNLINYAVKSGASQVNIGTSCADQYAILTVADDGPRIPPEEIGHVFDPFYTTRREGGGGAADLGLSLVHRIVSDHSGVIDVESPREGGVRFRIKLLLPVHKGTHA